MNYLICDHCHHANELRSQYLTFCQACGKKITHNFTSWKKENPGGSFDDFRRLHARDVILHWEAEPAIHAWQNPLPSRWITTAAGSALLLIMMLLVYERGPVMYAAMEKWALRKIQFKLSEPELWATSMFREGNFQIKFPAEPDKRVETSATVLGNFPATTYRVEPPLGKDDNLAYAATFTAYPPNIIKSSIAGKKKLDQFMHYTVEQIVSACNGKLLSEKEISYGLFPGREVRLDYKQGLAEIKCRIYLVESTLYTLQVTSPAQRNDNKARDVFLNSFKLMEYAMNQ